MKEIKPKEEKVKVKALSMRIIHGKVLTAKERNILRSALTNGEVISIDTCSYVEPGYKVHEVAPAASVVNIWEK